MSGNFEQVLDMLYKVVHSVLVLKLLPGETNRCTGEQSPGRFPCLVGEFAKQKTGLHHKF